MCLGDKLSVELEIVFAALHAVRTRITPGLDAAQADAAVSMIDAVRDLLQYPITGDAIPGSWLVKRLQQAGLGHLVPPGYPHNLSLARGVMDPGCVAEAAR